MALKLKGSTSGFTAIDAPAVAGDNTLVLPGGNGTAHQVIKNSATAGTLEYGLTLPSGNGSSGQYLQSDGTGGSSWATLPAAGTTWTSSVVSASGSGVELTGIPSTAQQIIIAYSEVSTDGNAGQTVQLGDAGGYETTGYYYTFGSGGSGNTGYYRNNTTVFFHNDSWALSSNIYWGTIFLTKAGGNFWNIFWRFNEQTSTQHGFCYGGKATSAALTQVKFAPTSGNWDAGQVNFKYLA